MATNSSSQPPNFPAPRVPFEQVGSRARKARERPRRHSSTDSSSVSSSAVGSERSSKIGMNASLPTESQFCPLCFQSNKPSQFTCLSCISESIDEKRTEINEVKKDVDRLIELCRPRVMRLHEEHRRSEMSLPNTALMLQHVGLRDLIDSHRRECDNLRKKIHQRRSELTHRKSELESLIQNDRMKWMKALQQMRENNESMRRLLEQRTDERDAYVFAQLVRLRRLFGLSLRNSHSHSLKKSSHHTRHSSHHGKTLSTDQHSSSMVDCSSEKHQNGTIDDHSVVIGDNNSKQRKSGLSMEIEKQKRRVSHVSSSPLTVRDARIEHCTLFGLSTPLKMAPNRMLDFYRQHFLISSKIVDPPYWIHPKALEFQQRLEQQRREQRIQKRRLQKEAELMKMKSGWNLAHFLGAPLVNAVHSAAASASPTLGAIKQVARSSPIHTGIQQWMGGVSGVSSPPPVPSIEEDGFRLDSAACSSASVSGSVLSISSSSVSGAVGSSSTPVHSRPMPIPVVGSSSHQSTTKKRGNHRSFRKNRNIGGISGVHNYGGYGRSQGSAMIVTDRSMTSVRRRDRPPPLKVPSSAATAADVTADSGSGSARSNSNSDNSTVVSYEEDDEDDDPTTTTLTVSSALSLSGTLSSPSSTATDGGIPQSPSSSTSSADVSSSMVDLAESTTTLPSVKPSYKRHRSGSTPRLGPIMEPTLGSESSSPQAGSYGSNNSGGTPHLSSQQRIRVTRIRKDSGSTSMMTADDKKSSLIREQTPSSVADHSHRHSTETTSSSSKGFDESMADLRHMPHLEHACCVAFENIVKYVSMVATYAQLVLPFEMATHFRDKGGNLMLYAFIRDKSLDLFRLYFDDVTESIVRTDGSDRESFTVGHTVPAQVMRVRPSKSRARESSDAPVRKMRSSSVHSGKTATVDSRMQRKSSMKSGSPSSSKTGGGGGVSATTTTTKKKKRKKSSSKDIINPSMLRPKSFDFADQSSSSHSSKHHHRRRPPHTVSHRGDWKSVGIHHHSVSSHSSRSSTDRRVRSSSAATATVSSGLAVPSSSEELSSTLSHPCHSMDAVMDEDSDELLPLYFPKKHEFQIAVKLLDENIRYLCLAMGVPNEKIRPFELIGNLLQMESVITSKLRRMQMNESTSSFVTEALMCSSVSQSGSVTMSPSLSSSARIHQSDQSSSSLGTDLLLSKKQPRRDPSGVSTDVGSASASSSSTSADSLIGEVKFEESVPDSGSSDEGWSIVDIN